MTYSKLALIALASLFAAVALLIGALHTAQTIARAQIEKIERVELEGSLR